MLQHRSSEVIIIQLLSRVPMGNCFWCYFRQLLMYLAQRECKNDYKILKIILVQIFVH